MPVEETEESFRVRVRMPGEFQDGSFRTIDIDEDRGIKAVIGRLRDDPDHPTAAQSFIFSKEHDWTAATAEKWVRDHGETPKNLLLYLVGHNGTALVKSLLDGGFGKAPVELDKGTIGQIMDVEVKAKSYVEFPFSLSDVYKDADGKVVIEGYASTESIDRDNEVIDVASMDLSEYQKNPILLFMHDLNKPVGKVVEIEKRMEDGETKLWVKAIVDNATVLATETGRLIKGGVLRAFSVFIKGAKRVKDGSHHVLKGGKLIEISVVSVPANPTALFSIAKSAAPFMGQIDPVVAHDLVKIGLAQSDEEAVFIKAMEMAVKDNAPNTEANRMPEGTDGTATPPGGGQEKPKQEAPAALPEEFLTEWNAVKAKVEDLEKRVAELEGAGGEAEASADDANKEAPAPQSQPAQKLVPQEGKKKSVVAGGQRASQRVDVRKMSKEEYSAKKSAMLDLAAKRHREQYPGLYEERSRGE